MDDKRFTITKVPEKELMRLRYRQSKFATYLCLIFSVIFVLISIVWGILNLARGSSFFLDLYHDDNASFQYLILLFAAMSVFALIVSFCAQLYCVYVYAEIY